MENTQAEQNAENAAIFTFSSNYGNFDYRMDVEVPMTPPAGPELRYLVNQGLANIAYRVCGSAVDKALGVVPESKGGKGRRGVAFNDVNRRIVEGTVVTKLAELAKTEPAAAFIEFSVTGEHEYGAEGGSPMARASAFVDALLGDSKAEAQLRATLALFDDRAIEGSRDVLVEIAHSKGLGIQKAAPKKTK